MSSCIQPHTRFSKIPSSLPFLSLKASRERRKYSSPLPIFPTPVSFLSSVLVNFLYVLCVRSAKDWIFIFFRILGFPLENRIILNQMKRASLSFDQSHATDDEAKEKLKYQSLLKEYLELQKEYVSRKRKLQAAKQKRELILSEVRFLRLKQKSFLKSQASDTDIVPLHTLQSGRNPSTLDQLLPSNSCPKNEAEGGDHAYDEDVRCTKKIKNHLSRDKVEGKRKICLLA